MNARIAVVFVLALAFFAVAPKVCAIPGEEIKPPFGLQWGETQERLENLLKGAKAQILDRHTAEDGRMAWTVEGLVSANLKRSVFYFKTDQLVEVELQYQNSEWDNGKYDDFMASVRRQLENKYGSGQLVARSKTPEGEVMQTLVGYKWNRNNAAVQLFYFAAEKGAEIYRAVSVHYQLN